MKIAGHTIGQWIAFIVIIGLLFLWARSCYRQSEKDHAEYVKKKVQDSIDAVLHPFEYYELDKTKVYLSAMAIQMHPDTAELIMKEYYKAINTDLYLPEEDVNIDSVVTVASGKYNTNKNRVAELIFKYKYARDAE